MWYIGRYRPIISTELTGRIVMNKHKHTNSYPLSVLIVFVEHIKQLQIHRDGQHQPLLQLWVLTDSLQTEIKKQRIDLQLVETSACDVTSIFLKSYKILNFEALESVQSGWTKKAEHLLLQSLSPHWELKKRCWCWEKKPKRCEQRPLKNNCKYWHTLENIHADIIRATKD